MSGLGAPTSSTGGFNPDALSPLQSGASLFGNRMLRTILPNDQIAAGSTIATSIEPVRTALAPIREQRYVGIAQQLQLADDPVTAAMLSRSSTVRAQRVTGHPKRVRVLQRFGWSVERIRHVGVYAGDTVLRWTCSHAARDCLVIGERLAVARVIFWEQSTNREIVHGAGRRCGNTFRSRLRQRAQQSVHDPLRHLDVAARHGRRRTGIHNRPLWSNDPHRSHDARSRRNIFRKQTTKYIEARRVSNRLDRVHAALDLRI